MLLPVDVVDCNLSFYGGRKTDTKKSSRSRSTEGDGSATLRVQEFRAIKDAMWVVAARCEDRAWSASYSWKEMAHLQEKRLLWETRVSRKELSELDVCQVGQTIKRTGGEGK